MAQAAAQTRTHRTTSKVEVRKKTRKKANAANGKQTKLALVSNKTPECNAFSPEKNIQHLDFQAFLSRLDPNSVDLVLTDPPYAISRKTGFKKFKNGVPRFAVSMDFGKWDAAPIDINALAEGMYKVLRKGGTAIVWYDLWKTTPLAEALQKAGFRMLRQILWQKTNPVPLNQRALYLTNSREMAIVAVKGSKPVFNSRYDRGIYNDELHGAYEAPIPRHNGHRAHPTQKPLSLFEALVQKHSKKGALVIDPFLGSGTTAIAALQAGRQFKGCDINGNYVRSARKWAKKIL